MAELWRHCGGIGGMVAALLAAFWRHGGIGGIGGIVAALTTLVDDYGWADAGWHRPGGYSDVQTPHLDALVKEGVEAALDQVVAVAILGNQTEWGF